MLLTHLPLKCMPSSLCVQIFLDGDWRNASVFLLDLYNSTRGNLTISNQTLADLKERVCEQNDLLRFFNFPNRTQAEDLKAQLCNLTVEQGTELFNDFRENFHLASALSEVSLALFVCVCVTVTVTVTVCVCG